MKFDEIYAVNSEGEIGNAESFDKIVCYAKRTMRSRPCASYTYDDYEIVDEGGNARKFSTGRFQVERIWTSGYAANYCLSIKVVSEDGEEYEASFYSDIRYNFSFESYILQKKEWDIDNPFLDIVPFFSEIEKYGIDAYKEILKLRKEHLDMMLNHKYAEYRLERYSHTGYNIEELVLREGMTEILDREFYMGNLSNIKRLVLPSTLKTIGQYAFAWLQSLETIVCKAVTPPKADLAFWKRTSGEIQLYVPAESVEAYKSAWHPKWNKLEILPIQ